MKTIKQITIKFDNEIAPSEVPLFRGAVNAMLDENHSVLFHNHSGEGLRYSYPLIQYKRVNKKATIVCVEEGVDVIGEMFSTDKKVLRIGEKAMELNVAMIKPEKTLVQVWQSMFDYRIRNWMPFNSKNYSEYKAMEGLAEKIALFERILTGNILSFLKGIGIRVDSKVECRITKMSEPRLIRYKGVRLMSFDAEFKSNVSIPHLVGIGKDASVGCGIVTRITTNKKHSDNDE